MIVMARLQTATASWSDVLLASQLLQLASPLSRPEEPLTSARATTQDISLGRPGGR
jgi:hypothetical protein